MTDGEHNEIAEQSSETAPVYPELLDLLPPVDPNASPPEIEPYEIVSEGDGYYIGADFVTITLTNEQVDEIFKRRFKEICKSIPVNCLRWIDPLCSIAAKDTSGIIPDVIDMQSASKSELAKCADLCKRLESMFQELFETAKTNRAQACKFIGASLEEDDEGDFVLTTPEGAERARFKRSEEFLVNVKDGNRMLGWLFLNGFGDAIETYYINPLTLKSIIKDFIKNGGAVPQKDIVQCSKDPLAKITKVYDVDGVWSGEIAIQKQKEIQDFTQGEKMEL